MADLRIDISAGPGPSVRITPGRAPQSQLLAARAAVSRAVPQILWSALSLGLFAGIWEVCWAIGIADPKLLPPPHIFLGDIADQAKFFNTVSRWRQFGAGQNDVPSPPMAVLYTMLSTTGRVVAGLAIAAVLAVSTG